ncbi:MAG: HAD family hydrolase [Phormidesmis sp.]
MLTPELSRMNLSRVRLVATDMDGTLTTEGEFAPGLLQAFEQLRQHHIQVMIVTGRSAGWVSALVNYLPIVGAIAENGGLYISKRNLEPVILSDIPQIDTHRDCLSKLFETLQKHHPHLQPSVDNPYRLTDWTFDIEGLSQADMAALQAACAQRQMGFTYSTVQCHLKLKQQDKATGLVRVLAQEFPEITADEVVTVGDSPNDESLFDPARFPQSVGVANVAEYLPALAYVPKYITGAAGGQGFAELVAQLVKAAT